MPDKFTDEACYEAAKYFRNASEYFAAAERTGDKHYTRLALGDLQDGLAVLGFDLVPLQQQPTATADAIFDDAAFNYGRGGV
jgi:hypothetical protein